MKPLSLRLRLTLGFSAAMAVLLAGAGLYIHTRVGSDLDAAIDRGLHSRLGDVAALVAQSDTGLRESPRAARAGADSGFAQILQESGRVYDHTPRLTAAALSPSELRAAMHRTFIVPRRSVPGFAAPARILARGVHAQGQQLVIVAGASLATRDRALLHLRHVLIAGGPVLLLLASLAGYALAALALRPVERMRRQAQEISIDGLGARLPLRGSDDEIDRLARTLNDSLDRVQTSAEHERAFVADASHELRTPLTVLRTQLDVLAADPRTPPAARADISSALAEVDGLARLADELLLIARSDHNQLHVANGSVRIDQLFECVCKRADPTLVSVTRPANGLSIQGEREHLERALANLVANALHHGGGRAHLRARVSDAQVELHVLDNGPGLPDGFAAHAFERFSRAAPSRNGDGAGLGLAIVRAIAEAHGGSAGIANADGGGVDVWIAVPRGVASE